MINRWWHILFVWFLWLLFKDAYIYFSLFCALTIWKGYILISVNCNKEFCRLSPYTVWLHKGPSIFYLGLLLFFGTGTHWLWTCRDSWFFTRWVLRLTILFLTKSLLILHDDVEPASPKTHHTIFNKISANSTWWCWTSDSGIRQSHAQSINGRFGE